MMAAKGIVKLAGMVKPVGMVGMVGMTERKEKMKKTVNHEGLDWLDAFFGKISEEDYLKAVKRQAHEKLVRINKGNVHQWAKQTKLQEYEIRSVLSPCDQFECGDAFGKPEVDDPFVFLIRYRGTRQNYTYLLIDIMQERILHAYSNLAYAFYDFDGNPTYRSQPIGGQAHTPPYNNWLYRMPEL